MGWRGRVLDRYPWKREFPWALPSRLLFVFLPYFGVLLGMDGSGIEKGGEECPIDTHRSKEVLLESLARCYCLPTYLCPHYPWELLWMWGEMGKE